MLLRKVITLLVISNCFTLVSSFFNSSKHEKDFLDSLLGKLTKYSPHVDSNRTVYAYMDLYQLLGVDEKEGVVSVKVWIFLTYYIDSIKWDPDEVGVEAIQVNIQNPSSILNVFNAIPITRPMSYFSSKFTRTFLYFFP